METTGQWDETREGRIITSAFGSGSSVGNGASITTATGESRVTLRKASSLSRLPMPQPPPRRSSPSSPEYTARASKTSVPVVKSPRVGSSSTLLPPPRTRRNLQRQNSPGAKPTSPLSARIETPFSYSTKSYHAPPPPRHSQSPPTPEAAEATLTTSSSSAMPTMAGNSPATSPVPAPRFSGSLRSPRSPPPVMAKPSHLVTHASLSMNSPLASSSSPSAVTTSQPATAHHGSLTMLRSSYSSLSQGPSSSSSSSSLASSSSTSLPQRPSRDRHRSHSPPTSSPPLPVRPPPPAEVTTRVLSGVKAQFVSPDVPGYVGFANLPNQVHRKSVKKGFEFTLMVVGESGLGKSTLVNSLFLTDLYPERQIADAAAKIEKTVKIDASTVEIEERGVKLRLTVVDTPGFADALNNDNCFKTVIQYIDAQFERYLHDESGLNRRHIIDNRVHCCFYFVNPAGHGLKPLDISFMRAIHHKVNIVPVIAKADTLTKAEVLKLKKKVLKQVEEHGIQIYQLPDCDEDEDEEYKEQCRQLREAVPFAVVGANHVIEVRGRKVRGRMYPWGVVEVENPEHCDFIKLRTMLVTHMQDLQEVTQEIHYENFRSEKLAVSDGVVRKPKTPRTSRGESDKEAKLSEKEHALQEKENELRRMQEMIARMQAEMKQQQQQQQQSSAGGGSIARPPSEAPPPPPASRPPQPANGAVNGHPQQGLNKPINTPSA